MTTLKGFYYWIIDHFFDRCWDVSVCVSHIALLYILEHPHAQLLT